VALSVQNNHWRTVDKGLRLSFGVERLTSVARHYENNLLRNMNLNVEGFSGTT